MSKYVYIDNSNVWIEGRRAAAVEHGMAFDIWEATENGIFDRDWKYDFGKLLELVGGKKNGVKRAVLFGSRPPQNDSLWEAARQRGFDVVVEDRNVQGREKKIDTGVSVQMMGDSYELVQDKAEDEMILVAGDKDYVPAVKHIVNRGIRVTVCFWDHAASELKDAASDFVSLNPYISAFTR
jgi:hypothetical protein